MIFEFIKKKNEFKLFTKKFRSINSHNEAYPVNIFRLEKVEIGNQTYGGIYIFDHSNDDTKVEIGHYCSIALDVKFILGSDHSTNCISSFPFKSKLGMIERESHSKGSIILKDDVWIAANSIILSGVTIGQGAVVAAGSVVTKDVPPYSIVAGVPARVIKYRFSEAIIKKLLLIDYSNLNLEKIKNHLDKWYIPVMENNVDELLKEIL